MTKDQNDLTEEMKDIVIAIITEKNSVHCHQILKLADISCDPIKQRFSSIAWCMIVWPSLHLLPIESLHCISVLLLSVR